MSRAYLLFETEEYGTLSLRSNLSIGNMEILSKLTDSEADAREFTVQAVSMFIHLPELSLEEIRSWSDDLLLAVATAWTEEKPEWTITKEPSFETFKKGFVVYAQALFRNIVEAISRIGQPAFDAFDEFVISTRQSLSAMMQPMLQGIQASLSQFTEPILDSFRNNFSAIVQSMRLDIQVGTFFPNLPDFSELRRQHKKIEETLVVLDECGYGFMHRQWSLNEIAEFFGVDKIDPRVRQASITNRLLGLIRSDDFAAALEEHFQNSSVLKPRWRIVERSLAAHCRRDYALSIPTLLTQVEGVFTDALILKNMAERRDGKLYIKNPDGTLKLDRNDRPIVLYGLGQKVQNSRFRGDDLLNDLVDFFTDRLIPERNNIMHGSHLNYDKAKLSVQLLLNVYFMAAEFAGFESEG